jgi:hypothetical protein
MKKKQSKQPSLKPRFVAVINNDWGDMTDECLHNSLDSCLEELRGYVGNKDFPSIFKKGDKAVVYQLVPVNEVRPVFSVSISLLPITQE